MWSGNGRDWVKLKGAAEPSRVLHFNPRPRGGAYIAMNNFLKGKGWGKEKVRVMRVIVMSHRRIGTSDES